MHEGVSEIATSTEALVLGKRVTDEIDSLGQAVVRARIDFMVKKAHDYDEVCITLSEKFYTCFGVIESVRKEVTNHYQKL